MQKSKSGFTIVELLIVIVVIGILASITIVAYNGIQGRAYDVVLQSDLNNAAKQMELHHTYNGSYPSALPADTQVSAGTVLQLTTTDQPDSVFCINGYSQNDEYMSYWSQSGLKQYLCSGAPLGSALGGDVPTAPRGVNLVSDFSTWTLSGGMTYHAGTGEIRSNSVAGNALSPLVRIDGSVSARLTVEAYATQPSPNRSPDSGTYFSSLYYGANGSTPATNTSGYQSNGNAQAINLSSWQTVNWGTPTGDAVIYVRFRLNSSPTSYTSDTKYRNPEITALD